MVRYKIQVKQSLSSHWTQWFEDLTVQVDEKGNTVLEGDIQDQSALFGILKKIRDLGLDLVSITPLENGDDSDGSI